MLKRKSFVFYSMAILSILLFTAGANGTDCDADVDEGVEVGRRRAIEGADERRGDEDAVWLGGAAGFGHRRSSDWGDRGSDRGEVGACVATNANALVILLDLDFGEVRLVEEANERAKLLEIQLHAAFR